MLNYSRLKSKKQSKTEAVTNLLPKSFNPFNIHVGPSDYVASQKDNKIAYLRLEGRCFGGVPFNLEIRLSVEDSPNSAGCVLDAIRCVRLARDRGIGGPLKSVSAFLMKHPPVDMPEDESFYRFNEFITQCKK